MFRVVIEPIALEDIEEALDWLSEKAPHKVRQHLFDRYPSKYRILFVIKGDIVHILQIRHGARRWLHEE